MTNHIHRDNFDGEWLASGRPNPGHRKFTHRPMQERYPVRTAVEGPLTEAIVDHHVPPEVLSGALERRGYAKTCELLTQRLPIDQRTRTGNFGEVLASEHLRQRYGYEMPVFKLRFMENPNMPMRGEDLVAFRLDAHRSIIALCVGESKALQTFDARQVGDAHTRLITAYHPHPVSLSMISNILHERRDPLATQVDMILETLGTRPVRRENWIFIITGNQPKDPFSSIDLVDEVVENLSCVDLRLEGLGAFIEGIFANPLPDPTP